MKCAKLRGGPIQFWWQCNKGGKKVTGRKFGKRKKLREVLNW